MPVPSVEQLAARQEGLAKKLAELGAEAEPAKRRALSKKIKRAQRRQHKLLVEQKRQAKVKPAAEEKPAATPAAETKSAAEAKSEE